MSEPAKIDWSKVKYLYPVQNDNGDIVAICTTKPEAVKIAGPDDEIGVIPIGLVNTNLGVAKYTPPTPAVTTYGEYSGETDLRPSKPRSKAPNAPKGTSPANLAQALEADGYGPLDLTTPEDEYLYGQPSTSFASGEYEVPPAWGSV